MHTKFMKHVLVGAVGAVAMLLAGAAQAAGTWETTLKGRDINGNVVAASSAVFLYDTTLKITWLRDAN